MKRLFAVMATFCVASVVFGQNAAKPFPRNDKGQVVFQEVVQVEGVGSDELYRRTKLWVVKAFKNAQHVIQLDDPASGTMIAKGVDTVPFGGTETLVFNFTLTIEVKDGRYRWTIDQLTRQMAGGSTPIETELTKAGFGKFLFKNAYEKLRLSMVLFARDLQKAMTENPTAKEPW